MDHNDFAALYQTMCQFDRFLGLQLEVHEPGKISYQLTLDKQHQSMPGACHGGAIAAMMDAVLGLTALSKVFPKGQLCQTVEFKINYLSAAVPGMVAIGSGQVEYSGKRLVVTTADIIDQDNHRPLAKGMGTFSLYPVDKKGYLLDFIAKMQNDSGQPSP